MKKITLLLTLTILLATGVHAALTDGLISYWAFDESSGGLVSDSQSNNDGALNDTGSDAMWVSGLIGNAWDGNGSRRIHINETNELEHQTFTLSYWIKPHEHRTSRPFTHGEAANPREGWGALTTATGEAYLSLSNNGASWKDIQSNGKLSIEQWNHVIVLKNSSGNEIEIWINGTLDKADTQASAINYADEPISIGHLHAVSGPTQVVNAEIDEMGYWNRSLNANEIAELYNSGAGTNPLAAAPAQGNMTLLAQSSYNQTTITTFNATINGLLFTTTNGTLYTNLTANNSNLYNITTAAVGFTTQTHLNINSSLTPITLNLTAVNTTDINGTLTWDNLYVHENLTIACPYTNATPYEHTLIHYIENQNDNVTTKFYGTNYTIQNSDFQDQLIYTCSVCTIYSCSNDTTTYTISNNTIDLLITFNTLSDYDNTRIATANITYLNTTGSYQENPHVQLATTFFNLSVPRVNETFLVQDTAQYHQDLTQTNELNETTEEINFTLDSNDLILIFERDGASHETEGDINSIDSINGSTRTFANFTNTSVIIVQQSLANGRVNVRFNEITHLNHTQYYEYINDDYTHINETLEVLATTDWSMHVKVIDSGLKPIEGATVRAYTGWSGMTGTTPLFIGQRNKNIQHKHKRTSHAQ